MSNIDKLLPPDNEPVDPQQLLTYLTAMVARTVDGKSMEAVTKGKKLVKQVDKFVMAYAEFYREWGGPHCRMSRPEGASHAGACCNKILVCAWDCLDSDLLARAPLT
jgi:hypothetical protein